MTAPRDALAGLKDIQGEPLSPESERLLDYLRTRTAELDVTGIRERVRAAAAELEKVIDSVAESDFRRRPVADKWNIAEVVDHIAQTQIRSAEELRHLFAGRRPPGPPVYEALRSGAAAWAPWRELVDGLRSANRELIELLAQAPGHAEESGATVRTILVINRELPGGGTVPQIFPADLDWKKYAILQRLHLLDHRTQIRKLSDAMTSSTGATP